jgi:hypothetical protein
MQPRERRSETGGFPFRPLPYEEKSVFEFTIGNFF